MARIRTIKPEFWSHPVLGRMSDTARLLAVALLNLADDEGYFLADAALVRNFARPYDSDSGSTTVALRELSSAGYIQVREHATHGAIGVIPNFRKHQQINKPTKSKLVQYFEESSGSAPVVLPSDSRGEGNREQGTGKGKEQLPAPRSAVADSPPDLSPVVLTFPCVGKQAEWPLTQAQVDAWAALYPGTDVLAEARKALAWVQANQRKTAGGMPKFLVGWLGRSNDRGKAAPFAPRPANPRAFTLDTGPIGRRMIGD